MFLDHLIAYFLIIICCSLEPDILTVHFSYFGFNGSYSWKFCMLKGHNYQYRKEVTTDIPRGKKTPNSLKWIERTYQITDVKYSSDCSVMVCD